MNPRVLHAPCHTLLGDGLRDRAAYNHRFALTHANGGTLHLHAHWSDRYVCIDIEPLSSVAEEVPGISKLQSVLETFKQAATSDELCNLAVHGLHVITGYDRVMAYRFHQDGHGEVIAEARNLHLEPYLGLHYPAADVPSQARRHYLRQRVGAIADSSYSPVPLLADSKLVDGKPLDLTHSTLRSVSPIHCEYMRNMKTAASLTIGLAKGQHLWGMLVCHHATGRIPRPEVRAVADMIGQVVSLMLGSLGEAETYAQRLKRNKTLRALAGHLDAPVPLPAAFAAAQAELLLLVDAAGALIRLSGAVFSFGQTPGPALAADALAVLEAEADGKPLALDDVGLRHPELVSCTSEGSGMLLLPLAHGGDDVIL